MTGMIFDIKEFAINDGPGIRTTVFMKGCPLRCKWCHNPEGLISTPQQIVTKVARRLAGKEYQSGDLANILRKNADVFEDTGGGVTFSGGEPLMQGDFLVEVLESLNGIHVLLDTSGYANHSDFVNVVSKVQHVYYDLKLIDSKQHLRWTGKTNEMILQNLSTLDSMKISYTIRIPLIPSITDTRRNLGHIAAAVRSLNRPQELHLLMYNAQAGAKYQSVGMEYELDNDLNAKQKEVPMDIFSDFKIPVRVFASEGIKKSDQ